VTTERDSQRWLILGLAFLVLILISAALPRAAAAAGDLALITHSGSSAEVDHLSVVDPALGTFTRLESSGGRIESLRDVAWNPTGKSLAYVADIVDTGSNGAAGGGDSELWIEDADRKHRTLLAQGGHIGPPAFAPSGKVVAYVAQYGAKSGRGCAYGGYAVTALVLKTEVATRASRCFDRGILRSRAVFTWSSSRVAFSGDHKHVVLVSTDGSDAGTRNIAPITTAKRGQSIKLRGYLPGEVTLWVENGSGEGRAVDLDGKLEHALPDSTFTVAPKGHMSIGNCSELPQQGICSTNLNARKPKGLKMSSAFKPDFTKDSIEFGFGFDRTSHRLVSFGYGTTDASGAPSGQEFCVRATIKALPACRFLPTGETVTETPTNIAVWRP
jgi:hypothetical protein